MVSGLPEMTSRSISDLICFHSPHPSLLSRRHWPFCCSFKQACASATLLHLEITFSVSTWLIPSLHLNLCSWSSHDRGLPWLPTSIESCTTLFHCWTYHLLKEFWGNFMRVILCPTAQNIIWKKEVFEKYLLNEQMKKWIPRILVNEFLFHVLQLSKMGF